MKFKVLSREKVEQYNVKEKHIVISIRDRKSERAILPELDSRLDTLFLQFSDFDEPSDKMDDELKASLFNFDVAKTVWLFIDTHVDSIETIVVNCEAGISRSAGMVAAISKVLNGEDDYFFKHFLPNMLVYKLMLKVKKGK